MPVFLPLGGTPGKFNGGRNPTLLPNFDRVASSGNGTFDQESPATFIQNNPRVDALGTLTVAGSITNGDTVTLTATLGTLPNGAASVTYPVVTSDTTITVAEGLADAINNSATWQAVGIVAEMGGTGEANQVVVHQNGPIGNMTTLSAVVNGGSTETITFSNSGVLAGGSGPIVCVNNFDFNFANGGVQAFFYGTPYQIGYDVLTQLVNQGMPIV